VAIAGARRAAVALAVLIGTTAGAPTVSAQPDPTTSTSTSTDPSASTSTTASTTTTTTVPQEDPDDLNLAAISPELRDVPVDSFDLQATDAALVETLTDHAAARDARVAAETRITELTAEDERLAGVIAAETDHLDRATQTVEAAKVELRDIAVARYIQGSTSDLLSVVLNDLERGTEAVGQRVVFAHVSDARIRRVLTALADQAAAENALEAAESARADVQTDLAASTAERERAAANEARLAAALRSRRVAADRARALAIVAGTDLPLVALDAYWRAQRVLAGEQPDCGLTWWALAGIGRSESDHGRFGVTLLEPDGETSSPIIGIRLDGTRNTRVITDTDDGLLDGDLEFDRAVGPMQFLPGTWRRNGRDGNGDDVVDPHNLYDAALASATMLCNGGPMRSEPDLLAGFFRYNRSQAYAERVLARGYGYQLATQAVPVLVAPLAVPPPVPPTTTTTTTIAEGTG
jgi:membrane-bound lytic murein transglycosylase B